jgi:hypothetical protein
LLGLFAGPLAFDVECAVETGGCGFGGVTEMAVEVAEGGGGGEEGIRDAVAGKLEEAFEELVILMFVQWMREKRDLRRT